MDAYQQSGDKLKVELLDIFSGFSSCLKQSELHRPWEKELLKALIEHLHIFESAQISANEAIAGFASEIVSDLNSLN